MPTREHTTPSITLAALSVLVGCVAPEDVPPPAPSWTSPPSGRDEDRSLPTAQDPSGPWFEDVTIAAGIDLVREPSESYRTMADRIGGGVCVLDVDGAAPLDLFFAGRRSGSRLYVGHATQPLSYADETTERIPSEFGDPIGCLAVDADGDADDDLVLTGLGTVTLLFNEGGVFRERPGASELAIGGAFLYAGAAAGDLDGDLDLDLVVAGFVDVRSLDAAPGCAACAVDVGAYTPIGNLLLFNEGGGRFVDVTAARAPALALLEPTLVVGATDLDGDDRADVYVGNDLGWTYHDRVLAEGDDGRLADVALQLGLAHDARGHGVDTMGWATADIDGNGVLDHVASAFEGHASPVFLCRPSGGCDDRSAAVGTAAVAESFRWGTALADFDLDSDPELFEAAGHVYTEDEASQVGRLVSHHQPPNLMMNVGEGRLLPVQAEGSDAMAERHAGRGLAVADLDDDGRPDVVLATSRGRPAVLRNVRPPQGHWLRVVLVGKAPNTSAVGARVWVQADSVSVMRERSVGEGYLGSFDPRLSFGINHPGPVTVVVRWPNGRRERFVDVDVDAEIVLEEP